MTESSTDHGLPREYLLDLVLADQRQHWQRGECVLVESYLARLAALAEDEAALLELIQSEVGLRLARGQTLAAEEYLKRFADRAGRSPSFAAQLRDLIEVELALGEASSADGSTDMAPPLPVRAAKATAPAGQRIGDYEVQSELGRGGMGVVYKARQTSLNRLVALKMIRAGVYAGEEELGRFRREAEAVACLQHPNIVQIYEIGAHEGRPYFSLEYVEGGSLAARLAGTPLPARDAAALTETLARAIHYAHQRGVIHRDLKPANILLTGARNEGRGAREEKEGWEREGPGPADRALPSPLAPRPSSLLPKITDFGLAKRIDLDSGISPPGYETQSGAVMGTPSYMAPEQARGDTGVIGPGTDVYALGAVLYELLTGRPPFKAASTLETVHQVLFEDLVPPGRLRPGLPRDLETICLKCLEKGIRQRYASALALAEDLGRFLAGEPIAARRTSFPERCAKWARRRPAVASLLAGMVLALALGASGIAWKWYDALAEAERARLAEQRAEERERVARRSLYAMRMTAAWEAWQKPQFGRLLALLAEEDPGLNGQLDLRSFEWFYLHRLCHTEAQRFPGGRACVAFGPDGRLLAAAGPDNTVKVWDADTGKEKWTLRGHTAPVLTVQFSPDRRHLASAGRDQKVFLWDLATGQRLREWKEHRGAVNSLAYSADGQLLASASDDRTVRLWDPVTGKRLVRFGGHAEKVRCVAFRPDGKMLASAGAERNILLWDVEGKVKREFPPRHRGVVSNLAFSPDGRRLASAGYDQRVLIWDASGEQDKEIAALDGGGREVTSVAYSPDGKSLASAGWDGAVRVWDLASRMEHVILRGHTGFVTGLAYRPDGKRLASAGEDRVVNVWDPDVNPEVRSLDRPGLVVHGIAFSPDSTRLASVGQDGKVTIWDPASGQARQRMTGHEGLIKGVVYAPNGNGQVASAGADGTVRLWDAEAGRELTCLNGHKGAVNAVAYGSASRTLVSAGADGTVRVWDTESRQHVRSLPGMEAAAGCVAGSQHDGLIAAGGSDGKVCVWRADGTLPVFVLTGHTKPVTAVAFSPDGRRLASASKDGTAKVWDLISGELLATLEGHTAEVQAACFSPDGERLATASRETVKIWDALIGRETLTLPVPSSLACGLAFSPDGCRLAWAGGALHGEIRLWDADRP